MALGDESSCIVDFHGSCSHSFSTSSLMKKSEEEEEEEEVGVSTLMASTPDPCLAPASPGRTPFPGGGGGKRRALPPVPLNSPDEENLEDILILEAAKQEKAIQSRLATISMADLRPNYLENNNTPKGPPHPPNRRNGKRLVDITNNNNNNKISLEDLDLKSAENRILSNDDKYFLFLNNGGNGNKPGDSSAERNRNNTAEIPSSSSSFSDDKEARRKVQMNSALEILRQIVPSLDENSDKADILEETARYLVFIKDKVGTRYDRDFLLQFLSF